MLHPLQVEDELFRVPKRYFVDSSEVFSDMFLLPTGNGMQIQEGSDDGHPIELKGYDKSDFISLLKIFSPRFVGNPSGTYGYLTNLPTYQCILVQGCSDKGAVGHHTRKRGMVECLEAINRLDYAEGSSTPLSREESR